MSTLYELNKKWQEVADMLSDPEADGKLIFDTLESIEGEIEDKAENCGKVIVELKTLQEAADKEIKRLQERNRILNNREKRIREMIMQSMKIQGKTKLSTNLFSFSIAKNGGKQKLSIIGDVPEEYTKTIIENDTDKIRQALQEGKELTFAKLEEKGENLRIK